MKDFLIKFFDLVLYSNFFIAICASSLAGQTFFVLGSPNCLNPTIYFIFFSTLFVYSMHRLIGFTHLDKTISTRRIAVIHRFQSHIKFYVFLSVIGMICTICFMPLKTILFLSVPALIAILYITPIFRQQTRFRDIPFVKVFAVGFAWAWVCVCGPMFELAESFSVQNNLMIVEKFLFIVAITIPFDIRDYDRDALRDIKTIPRTLGIRTSKLLSILLVALCTMIVLASISTGRYNTSTALALMLSYFLTIVAIISVRQKSHDYWFSGVLDGTIVMQLLFIYLVQ